MNVNENALIQVQDLKKSFGTQVVLDGITTEIDQGEVVAIIETIRLWKIYLFTLLKSVRRTDIRNDPV